MARRVPRNEPCPCGSGRKAKSCCHRPTAGAATATRGPERWRMLAIGIALGALPAFLVGHAMGGGGAADPAPTTAPVELDTKALAEQLPPGAPLPSDGRPPGPAPPGKVWSEAHGHWHDAPSASAAQDAAPPATEEEEAIARQMVTDARALTDEPERALELLDEVLERFPGAKVASRARQLREEVALVGQRAAEPVFEKWFVGSAADLDAARPRVLVFWEVWCPHCKREVPKLQELADRHAGEIDVIGLTRLTRSTTEEGVEDFVREYGVRYPVAKTTSETANAYAVSGVPAAAIVRDGEVVWRGHPARIDESLLGDVLRG